jgi:hypothetical protein
MASVTIALMFVSGVAMAAETPDLPYRESGEIAGAPYTIQIPENWNRGLVLFAHGYNGRDGRPSRPPMVVNLPLPEQSPWFGATMLGTALERGFAVASSAYSLKGWMVREGTLDTEALRGYFERTFGPTSPTIITGNHGGGNITLNLLEKFPDGYDAGLAWGTSAEPALTGLRERVFDMRLLFDYFFPPGLPGSVVDFSAPVGARENIPRLVAAHPDRLEWFLRRYNLRDVDQLTRTLGFYTEILRELNVERGLGNAFDNTNVIYTGSDDDGTLNREIPRFTAEPPAREYLKRWATLTGAISDPVLVVNALHDPIVDPVTMQYYHDVTQLRGTAHLYVQMWVDQDRSNYSLAHARTAFALLLDWIRTGDRPRPGELEAAR